MIAASPEELLERATRLAGALEAGGVEARVGRGTSLVGGGTCPGVVLDTFVVEPDTGARSVSTVARRLRRGDPPVLAPMDNDRLILDPRTVEPEEESLLVEQLVRACLSGED